MSKVVQFANTGGAEVLQMADLPVGKPGAGEVLVRIKAIGLNRAELMYRGGAYAQKPVFPSRIGCEAAGVVEAVGEGATRFTVGDRVSVLQTINQQVHGVYAEHTVVPQECLIASPAQLTDTEAAALWHAYAMAWGPLVLKARVSGSDTVLVTAASSAVGLAVIQVAKAAGATVIAATRSSRKAPALLGAGADFVVATEEEDLAERVMQITQGRGATIIHDSVLGGMLPKLCDAAAMGATIFLTGLLESAELKTPIWPLLMKGIRLEGFVGFAAVELDPAVLAQFGRYIEQGLAQGRFHPAIDRIFPLDEVVAAHRYMEAGSQVGKIVMVTQ
jgi:NADPH:quinone reductase